MVPQEFIDEIKFGNSSQDCVHWMNRQSFLDTHFTELTTFTYPNPGSPSTQDELMIIGNAMNGCAEDQELRHRYFEFDRKGYRFYKEVIDSTEIITDKDDFKKMVDDIVLDSSPLIYKLKQYFNRPRPAQIAFYYKVKLFPYKSLSVDCPAYPSASVFHARIICEVIGNRQPQLYGGMQQLFNNISASRIALGLNYPSDVEAAAYAAGVVLNNPEFKVKYKL